MYSPEDEIMTHASIISPDSLDDPATVLTEIFSPRGMRDPYPYYTRLRELAPTYLTNDGSCFVTNHAACEQVLRGPEFGAASDDRLDTIAPGWRDHLSYRTVFGSMFASNPPDHTRLRKLVTSAFTPRRVRAMQPAMEALVDRLLDDVTEQGSDGRAVDLMAGFAYPFPMLVVGQLLGIPDGAHAELRSVVRDWVKVLDLFPTSEEIRRADAAAEQLQAYVGELVADRRTQPRNDLISEMLNASSEGDHLSHDELMNMVTLLFGAGFETTGLLISNGLVALQSAPEQARSLATDPDVAPTAIEELLRFDSPVQMASRIAFEDVVINDVRVPSGTLIVMFLGAANHDPETFDKPDRLNLLRTPNRHLSFGTGIHACIGAILGRFEAQIALPALLRRFPDIRVEEDVARRPGFWFRGYDALPVSLSGRR